MNIFYLDNNTKLCAQYHCDKHVVKMLLESAQIICTVINKLAGEEIAPYKSTHVKHPCVIWAGESNLNFADLVQLFFELNKEYRFRFEKETDHKSYTLLYPFLKQNADKINSLFEKAGLHVPKTMPALAMPDKYKTNDPIESYRLYYKYEKQHLHKWTKREIPFWVT